MEKTQWKQKLLHLILKQRHKTEANGVQELEQSVLFLSINIQFIY